MTHEIVRFIDRRMVKGRNVISAFDASEGALYVLFALTLGLIVAIVAKDQLGAIAVMKALMPVWTSIPVLGFVLPADWQWTQWGFAHHWCVQGLFHVLQGDGVSILPHALLAFVLGLAALLPATWLLRRRLGLC